MDGENKKEKILIVDDSEFMRGIIKQTLINAGYINIIECCGGKEAILACKKKNPDLVILDLVMPEMTGVEALEKIGKDFSVVVISAVGQKKAIEEAIRLNAKGYLVKPFEEQELINLLDKLLN